MVSGVFSSCEIKVVFLVLVELKWSLVFLVLVKLE